MFHRVVFFHLEMKTYHRYPGLIHKIYPCRRWEPTAKWPRHCIGISSLLTSYQSIHENGWRRKKLRPRKVGRLANIGRSQSECNCFFHYEFGKSGNYCAKLMDRWQLDKQSRSQTAQVDQKDIRNEGSEHLFKGYDLWNNAIRTAAANDDRQKSNVSSQWT